jgi:uncharacterized membrane protein YdcZ (DUF606 family)
VATFLRTAVALLGIYLVVWTICFAVMFLFRDEAAPWDQYFSYLGTAWTFRGGEIPALILVSSLVVFVPLAAVLVFVAVRRAKRTHRAA